MKFSPKNNKFCPGCNNKLPLLTNIPKFIIKDVNKKEDNKIITLTNNKKEKKKFISLF